VGNGKLGMLLRARDASTLVLAVSSSAIWDDREQGSAYAKVTVPFCLRTAGMARTHHPADLQDNNFVCDRPRLPLGLFTVAYPGTLVAVRMRQRLHDGIVVGEVVSTSGALHPPPNVYRR
jgi:hypothetical protein